MTNLNALVFLAPPLGGKDTQCEFFIKHCERRMIPFLLVSTGNEFRSLPSSNHTLSLMKETMDSGGLLPDFLATGVVANSLIRNFEEGMVVIFNGFPRNNKQGKVFMRMMEFYKLTPKIIYIRPCDSVLVERMNERKKIQSRFDDSLEVLKRRIKIFKKANPPMVRLLKQNYEVVEVDCVGTPQEVHFEILRKLGMITVLRKKQDEVLEMYVDDQKYPRNIVCRPLISMEALFIAKVRIGETAEFGTTANFVTREDAAKAIDCVIE